MRLHFTITFSLMALTQKNASTVIGWALVFTLVIKMILSAYVPVTGDEAYYAIWGIFPQWGGYDHTPFIGWLLYPFLLLSKNPVVLRLPMVLITNGIGLGIYLFLKSDDKIKAAYASLIFLISPLSLCGVIITTDAPVILFTFLSGVCVLQAIKKNDHLGWFWAGGLFLGLAFFSKYFAVLLAFSYFIYFVFIAPNRTRIYGLIILFLGVLPFGIENLWWNYTHAWANILFNIYNRNSENHLSPCTVLSYILTLFYALTPVLFYYLLKYPKKIFKKQALNIFIIVPFLFFLVLSTDREIGMHWPLSFVTFIYIWAGIYLSIPELKKILVFLVCFTSLHLVIIGLILMTPIETFQHIPKVHISDRFYVKLVYFFEHEKINQLLKQYRPQYVFTSQDYVQADMMFYDSGIYSPTFGKGDAHGREDDLITDFNDYAHKDFLIFYDRKPRPEEFAPYFDKVEIKQLSLYGAEFYYVLGRNFTYLTYRDNILTYINKTYWNIPDYLPHKPSFFCEKYFKKYGCR